MTNHRPAVPLERYLDDLEARIDDGEEERLLNEWLAFYDGAYAGAVFSPQRTKQTPSELDWPSISINEAIADIDSMVLSQFAACSQTLANGKGQMLCVRCNYGSSIIPSLFGTELFFMDDRYNQLPTSWPVAGGKDGVRQLVAAGVPAIANGLGASTLAAGHRFFELMQAYPRIAKHIYLYHPDLQGPMDICEVVWGSSLFLDIVDEPNLVKEFLDLVTETYALFMRAWQKLVPPEQDWSVHWGMVQQGQIMLRDDSAMNFSPAMFSEFIQPYDQRLLTEFGGGSIHFCGRGDHYIPLVSSMSGLHAVNMSQPEYNDMEQIYAYTVDKDIYLIGLACEEANRALRSGRCLHGRVHCR